MSRRIATPYIREMQRRIEEAGGEVRPSRRGGDEYLQERFWNQVTKTETCWLAGRSKRYGRITWQGRRVYAHRFAYELLVGPIADGLEVDHRCGVKRCVNPDHLRLVTRKQNQEHRKGPRRDCESGARGVTRNGKGWRAKVRHNGRDYYAGTYPTIEEAAAAAEAKRQEFFSHDDNGGL